MFGEIGQNQEKKNASKKETSNVRKFIGLILLSAWLSMVFSFSAQSSLESNQLSKMIAGPVTSIINIVLPPPNAQFIAERLLTVNMALRKGAHITLYFLLGCLIAFFFRDDYGKISSGRLAGLFALCFLLASLDEAHQLFVPGRTAQTSDVVIDSVGAFFGIMVVNCVCLYKKRKDR